MLARETQNSDYNKERSVIPACITKTTNQTTGTSRQALIKTTSCGNAAGKDRSYYCPNIFYNYVGMIAHSQGILAYFLVYLVYVPSSIFSKPFSSMFVPFFVPLVKSFKASGFASTVSVCSFPVRWLLHKQTSPTTACIIYLNKMACHMLTQKTIAFVTQQLSHYICLMHKGRLAMYRY